MNLTFQNPGFAHSVDSILLFLTEGEAPYWSDSIFYFYPQVDKGRLLSLDSAGKKAYLTEVLGRVYEELQPQWLQKLEDCNRHFQAHRPQIEDALSEAFALDTRPLFNDLRATITLNPICPRFLKERYFDVFHLNSHRGALGIALHEIIHYLWFHVWNGIYHDSYDQYERPSMKWILSEMVVESIMRDERLSTINPYFPRENGGSVYDYFQTMVVDGAPILDTLDRLYRQHDIKTFMEVSYRYCLDREPAIRSHIRQAESAF